MERWGALPLGELHPEHMCAMCGSSGEKAQLKPTVLAMTRARALICVDIIACERRRYLNRRIA